MSVRDRWARVWPALLAVTVVATVGTPAAVASYRHARDVVISTGDTVMAPWLPLSVDGMLLAALVVMWVRRHRGEKVGRGPWAAFIFGMVVTVAANLEAVNIHPTPLGPPDGTDYVVALFPPLALAIALELVALVAKRTAVVTDVPEGVPAVTETETETETETAVPVPAETVVTETVPVPVVTEDVPVPAVPAVPTRKRAQPDRATDEQVTEWLRTERDTTGTVPGRRAAADRWAVGSTRYDRLVALVEAEPKLRVAR